MQCAQQRNDLELQGFVVCVKEANAERSGVPF
jgi:hypothetical protein